MINSMRMLVVWAVLAAVVLIALRDDAGSVYSPPPASAPAANCDWRPILKNEPASEFSD